MKNLINDENDEDYGSQGSELDLIPMNPLGGDQETMILLKEEIEKL
jgi:hypothetical protein